MTDDPIMERIGAAIGRLHAGERDRARDTLAAIWSEIESDPDPFHTVTLAHFMADTQDDVAEELAWDLRALEAARQVTQERAESHHASLSIKSFFPSLHLNAGDAYLRLGKLAEAREQLAAAQAALGDIGDSPLAEMTRNGIAGLAQRIAQQDNC